VGYYSKIITLLAISACCNKQEIGVVFLPKKRKVGVEKVFLLEEEEKIEFPCPMIRLTC